MGRLPIVVLFAAVGFFVLYPIASLNGITFATPEHADAYGRLAWWAAFAEPGIAQSLANTLYVVGVTQLISMPIAVIIAWLLGRTNLPGSQFFEFCFWITFFLPSLGVLTGWLLLFDPDFGLANEWAKSLGLAQSSPFNLYSFWGIIFVHLVTHSIGVKVMLLTPSFRNLDSAIEDAARMCGASRIQTFRRIVIPVLIPAISMVLVMSIVRGLETFEIELVLGGPIRFQVYSTKIYLLMADSPPELHAAGALALSIMGMTFPLVLLQRWLSTRRSNVVVTGRASRSLADLGRWRWPIFATLLALVAFICLAPLCLLIAGTFMRLFGFFDLPQVWTIDHWASALNDVTFKSGFSNMLIVGSATAILAASVCIFLAYAAVRSGSRLSAPIDWISWLPLTIPGLILGFGYLNMAVGMPVISQMYGTIGILILVLFLAAMPQGTQLLKVQMLQMSADIEEAGRTSGASWLQTFRLIILPLSAPSLAVVALMAFSSAIRSVSSIMLLSSGSNRLLSILQIEFLSNGNLGPAAVIGTVIVSVSLVAAVLLRMLMHFGVRPL